MTTAASLTTGSSPRRALLADAARRIVHARLDRLEGGAVTVREGTRAWTAGRATGPDPLATTLRVRHPRMFRRAVLGGSIGVAASFLDGDWSCDDLTSLFRLFLRNVATTDELEGGAARLVNLAHAVAHRVRRNTRGGSRRNIQDHYDLGNDFFALFLDETMTYSCGIFERPDATLQEASEAKLDRICRKLELGPDDHVLEIGTGWGSFAIHAARHYGCRVTTTTISPAQHALARQRVRDAGLEGRIELLERDYRDLDGTYDKLVSIEMIEAVGHEHLGTFFGACADRLAPDGTMLLQAITMPDHRYERYRRTADFIQRYVFPGSCCPSLAAMHAATARHGDLRTIHLEDIGPHYATTLRTWRERFHANVAAVRALGYPRRLERLWEYYLSYCEAGFAEGYLGTVQMLLARPGHRARPLTARTEWRSS